MYFSRQSAAVAFIAASAVLTVVTYSPRAHAQPTVDWTGLGLLDTENWFEELNWSTLLRIPDEDDVVVIGLPSLLLTPTITSSGGEAAKAGTLNVGVLTGSGELLISSGGVLETNQASLGNANLPLISGTVTVTGPGSVWNNSGLIRVGGAEFASGNLTIDQGGSVVSDSITVGDAGTGVLSLSQGGTLSSKSATLGGGASSSGAATVAGADTVWSSASLIIGASGEGALSITEGGLVDAGSLVVGSSGTGDVSVAQGGLLTTVSGLIGLESGSVGAVTVSGQDSMWTTDDAVVGVAGDGSLTVVDSGVASIAGSLQLASEEGSIGTLNIGNGGAAGFVDAAVVEGGAGSATLNFNHNEADYLFTRDGSAEADVVGISGSTAVLHSGSGTTRLTGDYDYSGGTTVNAGTLRLDGGSISHADANVVVGDADGANGSFVIENGAQITAANGVIGQESGAAGSATVTGADSVWNSVSLTLGDAGTGVLSVEDGGLIDVASLIVGSSGAGVLNVLQGGVVSVDGQLLLAELADSVGTLNIGDGAAAGLVDAAVVEGGAGSATLNFNHNEADYLFTRDGSAEADVVGISGSTAVLHSGSGTTRLTGDYDYSGGTTVNAGTLRLDGGSIDHLAAAVVVGGDDGADFTVENGAVVASENGVIGQGLDTEGTVTVTGLDSSWTNSGSLIVGDVGTGVVSVEDGGLIDVASLIVGSSGTGVLNVLQGGVVSVDGQLLLAELADSVGTLNIGDGAAAGLVDAAVVEGGAGSATLNFNHNEADYLFTRDGSAEADVVGISGSTAVLHSGSGTTRLTGDYDYSGGTTVNAGTLRLDGGSIDHLAAAVVVGGDDGADFTVENGAVVASENGVIGQGLDTEGTVTVTGLDSSWTNSDSLIVGEAGTGVLNVLQGGVVSVDGQLLLAELADSVGTLNIGNGGAAGFVDAAVVEGGAGSATLNFNHNEANYLFTRDGSAEADVVGISGSTAVLNSGSGTTRLTGDYDYSGGTTVNAGTLRLDGGSISHAGANVVVGDADGANGSFVVESGAQITAANGVIGQVSGAAGSATVTGADSVWNSVSLTVGDAGTGVLSVTEGGLVDAGSLVVGGSGVGALSVSQGGLMTTGSGSIGLESGSVGAVAVSGQDSVWTTDDVVVGVAGDGSLTVSESGVVTSAGSLQLASEAGSTGTLNIGDGAAAGFVDAIAVEGVAGSATLNFNHNEAEYLFTRDGSDTGDGVIIAGSTAVNHVGSGTTVLTTANSYTGNTLVSAGTLRAGAENVFGDNSASSIAAGATLDANNFNQALGSLSGAGQVLLGTASLTTGGNDADTLFSGVISGEGDLIKAGDGTLTLIGANTYSGGTTIEAGRLQVGNGGVTGSIVGDVGNDGVLAFNRADTLAFDGVISGSGALNQVGNGTLILTGESDFSGPTTVESGRLLVNGGIANSPVTVNSGGILGGNGTVGGIIANGGTIAPGNFIGTLMVDGDVDFSAGGVYQVEADDFQSDRIVATGSATLTGGEVNLVPLMNSFAPSRDYTILTADNGLIGEFDAVVSNLPIIFAATLSQDANNVVLNVSFDDQAFTGIANTKNQRAVANALAQLAGNPAMGEIFDTFLVLDEDGVRLAFETLNGAQLAHAQSLTSLVNRQFQTLLFNRLNGTGLFLSDGTGMLNTVDNRRLQRAPGYSAFSGALGGVDNVDTQREQGFWVQALGGFGDIDSSSGTPGADFNYAGITLGYDTLLPNDILSRDVDIVVGGAIGFTESDADTDNGADLEASSIHLAGYTRIRRDDLYLNAAAGYGWHDIDSKRRVVVGDSTTQAKANFDGSHFSLAAEGGRDFPWQEQGQVTPFIGLEYTRLSRDGFTENGAGAANLRVSDDSQNSLRSALGGRLSYLFEVGDDQIPLIPSVEIAYVREYLDDKSRVTAGFAAAPGATFRVDGPSLDRNRVRIGTSVTALLSERSSLHFGYQGEIAGSDDHHSFAATFRRTW